MTSHDRSKGNATVTSFSLWQNAFSSFVDTEKTMTATIGTFDPLPLHLKEKIEGQSDYMDKMFNTQAGELSDYVTNSSCYASSDDGDKAGDLRCETETDSSAQSSSESSDDSEQGDVEFVAIPQPQLSVIAHDCLLEVNIAMLLSDHYLPGEASWGGHSLTRSAEGIIRGLYRPSKPASTWIVRAVIPPSDPFATVMVNGRPATPRRESDPADSDDSASYSDGLDHATNFKLLVLEGFAFVGPEEPLVWTYSPSPEGKRERLQKLNAWRAALKKVESTEQGHHCAALGRLVRLEARKRLSIIRSMGVALRVLFSFSQRLKLQASIQAESVVAARGANAVDWCTSLAPNDEDLSRMLASALKLDNIEAFNEASRAAELDRAAVMLSTGKRTLPLEPPPDTKSRLLFSKDHFVVKRPCKPTKRGIWCVGLARQAKLAASAPDIAKRVYCKAVKASDRKFSTQCEAQKHGLVAKHYNRSQILAAKKKVGLLSTRQAVDLLGQHTSPTHIGSQAQTSNVFSCSPSANSVNCQIPFLSRLAFVRDWLEERQGEGMHTLTYDVFTTVQKSSRSEPTGNGGRADGFCGTKKPPFESTNDAEIQQKTATNISCLESVRHRPLSSTPIKPKVSLKERAAAAIATADAKRREVAQRAAAEMAEKQRLRIEAQRKARNNALIVNRHFKEVTNRRPSRKKRELPEDSKAFHTEMSDKLVVDSTIPPNFSPDIKLTALVSPIRKVYW